MTTKEARSALKASQFETLIRLILRRSLAAHSGVMGAEANATTQRNDAVMSTVLGMLVMMPVVFGVGGYALVSRRP
jgi:hypothetical protein